GDGGVQVETSAVLRNFVVRQVEQGIAERLIDFLTERDAHELPHRQVLGFGLLALEEQVANLGQVTGCAVMGVVVRLTGPHGVFFGPPPSRIPPRWPRPAMPRSR